MHSIFRKISLLFCVLQSISLALGTNFLNFSENANDLALGRHPAIGGSSVINPSLIKQHHESPIFSINSGNWYGDISISGLNYVHKVGNYNNRLFLKQAEINDLEFRGSEPLDDPNAMFSAYGFQLGSGVSIKNKNNVYYEMYKEAKRKAKMARNLALSSYLEAKRIKNVYMLDETTDSDDSDFENINEE